MAIVARRELLERARDRSFHISAVTTLALVVGAAILAGALKGKDEESYTVAAQGEVSTAIAKAAGARAPEGKVKITVEPARSEAQARRDLREERIDAALLRDGRLLTRDDPPQELEQLLRAASGPATTAEVLRRNEVSRREATLAMARALRARGLDRSEVRRALDPPPLRAEALEPEPKDERRGVALAATFLLYGQLITFGLWVAMGVVEEKSSRVVEVLLATLSPRDLLTGKVLGLGLLALVQLLLTAVIGALLADASGAIDLDGPTLRTLGVVLVWFVLGFVLYAWLYAMTAVLVSRQEDLQSATTPLTMAIILAFFVAFPAVEDPSGTVAKVASIVPFSSPIVMPVRVALEEASAPEVVASLVALAATVALLIPLGSRIYESAVLRIGQPLKLVEAWRARNA